MRATRNDRRGRAVAGLCAASLLATLLAVAAPAPAGAVADHDDYVALGDSYTAGPLIPDQTGQPAGCLRSNRDYPHLVAQTLGLSLTDVSCSAAQTDHMAAAQNVSPGPNPAQFNALSADTDIVTVGIGGNDIGFGEIIQNCVAIIPLTAVCQPDFVRNGVDEISRRITATAPKVAAVIQGIRARSPHARIYVVGYPAILPESGGGCWPSVPLSNSDLPWLRAKNKELNAMLATTAVANGARYVDVYTPGIGHDACQGDGTRWIEGIIPRLIQAAPIHPNANGMAGMARVVAARIAATPSLPSAPRGVVATAGDRQVSVTWSAPDDDGGGAIGAYRVFRDATLVHTTADGTARSFVDTGRTNGTTYRYTVAAVNASGAGTLSAAVSATPAGVPGAPAAPTVTAGDGEVDVSWSPPAATGGTAVTGYRLYRDATLVAASFGAGDTGYLDTDVANGTTYRYRVAAVNAVGEGPQSGEASATPEAGFTCCPPNGYVDVPADVDAAVDWARYFGVATGFADDTFRPARATKRSQAVAMLWHLMDEPVASRRPFSDVAATASYAPAVDWAVAGGLIAGFGDGTFRPKDPVTRAQLVAMIWRMVGRPTVTTHHAYTDTRPGAGYQAALDWAANLGLVDDPADTTRFHPRDPATRGVAVTWLYRLVWTADAWSATTARPGAILF